MGTAAARPGSEGSWPLTGLSAAEVAERVARGEVNDVPSAPSRTVGQILRGNTLTLFNAIIGSLCALVLVYGNWRDALFGLVVVANTGVGVVQELRAKRTLDRLAVVGEARPRVRRDAAAVHVPLGEVVLDDLVLVAAGDKVVVDGVVREGEGLEVDESLLTGEADPIAKAPGDEVLSGSFVTAGSGAYQATRVGARAFAAQLAEEAKRFTLVRSDLMAGINRVLRVMVAVMVPVGVLLAWTQMRNARTFSDAVAGAVAGVVTMIPEGLVLLTSVAFAVGVVRLGRHQVLVQELPAIEGLARVDVVCLDKTGTLTEPGLRLTEVRPVGADAPVETVLRSLVAAFPDRNASLAAVAEAYPVGPPVWAPTAVVAFSSARRWSGAGFGVDGEWALGAPEALLDAGDAVRVAAEEAAGRGLRVLVLARVLEGPLDPRGPGPVAAAALVVLDQRVKPDAAATLRYFADQQVAVKVVSGDSPRTVAAVVALLGVPGATDGGVDGSQLPDDPAELAAEVERAVVFGRVGPRRKRDMVEALQRNGHTVAMTGDGVNDVLALKSADIGVAMASGSEATRAVAQLVLVDNRFEHLPEVVAEGRRVINNVERVANLFLTKTVYATCLSLLSGVAGLPFPFLPRHLTVVSTLTIGIPGFFLALAPDPRRSRPGFVRRVVRFALPCGVVAAAASFGAYAAARLDRDDTSRQDSTLAAIVLFLVVWWVVVVIARPLTRLRRLLAATMLAAFLALLATPWTRAFFAFELPDRPATAAGLAVAAAAIGVIEVVLRVGPLSRGAPSRPPRERRVPRARRR